MRVKCQVWAFIVRLPPFKTLLSSLQKWKDNVLLHSLLTRSISAEEMGTSGLSVKAQHLGEDLSQTVQTGDLIGTTVLMAQRPSISSAALEHNWGAEIPGGKGLRPSSGCGSAQHRQRKPLTEAFCFLTTSLNHHTSPFS